MWTTKLCLDDSSCVRFQLYTIEKFVDKPIGHTMLSRTDQINECKVNVFWKIPSNPIKVAAEAHFEEKEKYWGKKSHLDSNKDS